MTFFSTTIKCPESKSCVFMYVEGKAVYILVGKLVVILRKGMRDVETKINVGQVDN